MIWFILAIIFGILVIYATCFRNADGYLKITYLYTDTDEAGEENYKNETIKGESAQIYLKDDVVPHVDAYKPVFS